jgi:transcriptional regulator with XRE-family HTH domain/quercetin dioxygenase-like cupin family protein
MPASSVGQRIRDERLKRGMSLRALARAVGVSPSMISQIETAKSQPSVSTLYAITTALGMSVQDAFTEPAAATAEVAPEVTQRDAPLAAHGAVLTMLEALRSPRGGDRLGPLVRPAERPVLTLDSGVTWERLGVLPGHDTEFLLVTYAPGGSSSSTGELMRHPGSEFGLMLRGELLLTLGFDDMALRPGDSVSFDSTTPHRYRNDGVEPAVGVWFVIEEPH